MHTVTIDIGHTEQIINVIEQSINASRIRLEMCWNDYCETHVISEETRKWTQDDQFEMVDPGEYSEYCELKELLQYLRDRVNV